MEILDSFWFSGKETIGIVVVKTSHNEVKAYMGVVPGDDQKYDEKYLASSGTPVHFAQLKSILNCIEENSK